MEDEQAVQLAATILVPDAAEDSRTDAALTLVALSTTQDTQAAPSTVISGITSAAPAEAKAEVQAAGHCLLVLNEVVNPEPNMSHVISSPASSDKKDSGIDSVTPPSASSPADTPAVPMPQKKRHRGEDDDPHTDKKVNLLVWGFFL